MTMVSTSGKDPAGVGRVKQLARLYKRFTYGNHKKLKKAVGECIVNIQWNIEFYIYITALLISLIGSHFIIRINWKRYGLLFLLSGLVCSILHTYTFSFLIGR